MNMISRILSIKYRIFDNHLRNIRRHVIFHLTVGLFVLLFAWGGGMFFFDWLFGFLIDQEPFGQPLINLLMSMVLISFFAMLTFSNLIVTLSTTYVSREVEFFMTLPLTMKQIFWSKLIETTLYSSWAFAVMSMPTFVAYGQAWEAGWWFYPALLLLMAPFIAIPAGLGALITMVVSAFVPARKARFLAIGFGAVAVFGVVVLVRIMGGRAMAMGSHADDFGQVMAMLTFGGRPWLPNVWLVKGMLASAQEQWGTYCYWLAMLVSTALMVGQVCSWLIEPLYYRGWTLARDTSSAMGRSPSRRSLFDYLDWALGFLSSHTRALTGKDVRTFWRDPVQWSQLLMFFALLIIYLANFSTMSSRNSDDGLLATPLWQARLSIINMGVSCFILSIISTRFMYPMLSLEGRQAWIIGLAPMKKTGLVWQKYWLCWSVAFVFTELIAVLSGVILRLDTDIFLISLTTILFLSFGLTSLAVGLGAMTPNFAEDNPARIANGLGGTVNVILSLAYVGGILALEGSLYIAFKTGAMDQRGWSWMLPAGVLSWFLIHAVAITIPMWLGLRRWRRIEF